MTIWKILKQIGISPKNKDLFCEAITHPSYTNENNYILSYQRLEFLGDAILSKATALKVFKLYPNLSEGQMTIIRSNSISSNTLAKFSKELNLDKILKIGKKSDSILLNTKILADVFEALVGAIYLDQGQKILNKFLEKNLYKFIINSKGKEIKNPKTIFQEFLQLESRKKIIYVTKPWKKQFVSIVKHDKQNFGRGMGTTKKQAEKNAAQNALNKLDKEKKNEVN